MKDQHLNEEKLVSIRKILGEPVFIGFSEYVLKLRRNLVALSATIIFYKWVDAKPNNIFVLDFTTSEPYKIDFALLLYLLYSALYFFSEGWESVLRWKIRLSGTFVKFDQSYNNENTLLKIRDKPFDILEVIQLKDIGYCDGEQSYLYSLLAQAICANTDNLQYKINTMDEKNITNSELKNGIIHIAISSKDAKEEVDDDSKKRAMKTAEGILEIVKSGLERFQNGFKNFQRTQVIGFFIWNISVPVVLTIYAIYMLLF